MVRFPPCQSFEPVPASPAQRSGRGFGPRDSSGTLQLSTRCSSADLLLSRSLAVRAGSAANCFLAISCDDAAPFAATAQLHPSNIATTRLMLECIVETASLHYAAARASIYAPFQVKPPTGGPITVIPESRLAYSQPSASPQIDAAYNSDFGGGPTRDLQALAVMASLRDEGRAAFWVDCRHCAWGRSCQG